MDSNQISDQIVEAINIIAKKKIEAISFDTTIEATIIDDSRASEGIYMVSNGSASFEAVSTETGYKKNDAVLVTIPQGDYSKQKIIAGKQVNKTDNSPIVYQSPFKTILNMTNNLIGDTSKIGEIGMIANHPNEYCWDVNTEKFTDSIAYAQAYEGEDKIVALIWDSEDSLSEGEFNHTQIGIKAQFSTWLEEYGVASGNYGLAAEIFFTHKDDIMSINAGDTNITQDIIDSHSFSKIIYLDSDSFFGNVYNFESYYTQEKTYDISEYTDFPITRIRLFAYQRNNFKDVNNNKIKYEEELSSDNSISNVMPNIFIKDPYICLGTQIEQFTTDSAEIVTKQGYTYTQKAPELEVNENDENLEKNQQITEILENDKGISLTVNQILKNSFRERYNLFYKYLKKVLLNRKEKAYTRADIVNIFNALVAAKNGFVEKTQDLNSDWQKNKISTKENIANPWQSIESFLNMLATEENLIINNEKTLELRWIHKDDFTDEVGVMTSLPEDYKVYWFKYREEEIDTTNEYPFMGAHWICIDEDSESEGEEKKDSESEEEKEDINYNDLVIPFKPKITLNKEQVQAVVVKEENNRKNLIVKSNIIEFTNLTIIDISGQMLNAVMESLDDLAVRFDDNSNGNYLLYNRAKKLSSNENSIERTLTLVFDENESLIQNKQNLTGPCEITWRVPRLNTMINLIKWPSGVKREEKNDFYVISYKLLESDQELSNIQITYKIKDVLNYQDNNNTIFVDVKKETGGVEQTYTASATMYFGSSGTSGSDYTIRVNWSNDQKVFDIDEANRERESGEEEYCLSGTVEVLNQDGKNIKLNEDVKYEYSWYKAKCNNQQVIETYALEEEIEEENEEEAEKKRKKYPINNNAIGRLRILISDGDDITEVPFPYLNSAEGFGTSDDLDGISEKINNIQKKVAYCYANKIDGGESQGFHHGDGSSLLNKSDINFYEYDLVSHEFKKIDFSGKNRKEKNAEKQNKILYTTNQIRNEAGNLRKRYKITFKPFDRSYGTRYKKNDQDSGNDGIMLFKDDNTVEYYYGNKGTKRRAFIKDNDHFIIDPYDQYYDNLTYYYPVFSEEEKTYSNTTLAIDGKENAFQIKKSSDNLDINDLYILQITLKDFADYPLIARFPIALKQLHLYQDEFERMIIPDAIKGPTEVRYATSGEIDFDKTSYAIHLQEWEKSLEENNQDSDETNGFTQRDSYWANTEQHTKGYWRLVNTEEKVLLPAPINYKTFLIENLNSDNKKRLNALYNTLYNNTKTSKENFESLISWIQDNSIELFNQTQFGENEEDFQIPKEITNDYIKELIIKLQGKNIITADINILEKDTPVLTPLSVYFEESNFYGVQFVLKENEEEVVLWTQPIYIYQDNYPSTTLNRWSGQEIITDNKTGLITANGFSAGKKEADNTFTGVVIGDWSKSDTDEMITKQTGIYGFNHGAMSYALKDDGTAFFGKDGKGRIYFDGNNARIYSANWIKSSLIDNSNLYKQDQEGMMIDVDKGELLVQKKVGNISIVKDSDIDETSYIYTSVQDNRKISLNENGLIISRRSFTLNGDGELEDLGSEKRLFELEMNSQESDDDVFYNFKYALRTPDYNYSNISSTYQTNGKIISGMEINFANQTITAFNSPKFDDQSSFKQKGFKLQAGGQWDATAQGTKGFKIIIDCQDKDDKVLKIGSSMPTSGANENFYVKTNGEIKGTLLQGNIIEITSGNFSVNTSGHLTCERIISKNKFLNFEGGLHIIGKDDQNDSLSCYKYYIDENHYDRGNIWCGEINCTSIKINGHTLTVGQPTYNEAPGGNSPKLCLDGYGIDY